ncbi:MAG: DUF4139 domain-containing protein [Candidatus Solibacter usitatus]|nr:DUF4139 domain-containing protein [Candidatus Solibacter usitatus]
MRFLMLLCAASLGAAELPVRTVILYKHGVGYFERSGELRSGESARLDFNASDMNDVLKSLTIEDKSGGKITGIRYDASEPLDKRLADYPFQLGSGMAMSQLLDQLKGARFSIRTMAGENTNGIIMGARAVAVGEKAQEKEFVTLMLDSGEIHTYDIAALSWFKLADAVLERKLKDYLATLAVSRSKEKRSVYLDSSDTRTRQMIASYMTPMPSWKSSYRLIMKTTESMLEGWAIVDNTTGEDWTNITLSLVSGRPISFISRLYEPRYRIRPEAALAEEGAVRPTVYSGSLDGGAAMAMMAPKAERRMAQSPGTSASMTTVELHDAPRAEMQSTIAVNTAGREIGDLFEYRFSTPVTVRKSESAMLPFLQQKIDARKLLIYSDRSTPNPMNAAEITNSSGKTLDGGPITVYDGGAYAGEALVETFKASDKRLISYGVDLGTRITTALDSTASVIREITANRGVLTARTAAQETLTYTIRNVDAKAKTLIIEHPVRYDYKVLNQKPVESTASAHRFEVKLAPQSTAKFTVNEERVYAQTTYVSSITPAQLTAYVQNKALSAEGRRQLEAIAAQKRQIAETDGALQAAQSEMTEMNRDQDRIRQNLESLNRVTGQQEQVQRYAKELAAQEAKIAGLRDAQNQLRRQKESLQQALNAAMERITF